MAKHWDSFLSHCKGSCFSIYQLNSYLQFTVLISCGKLPMDIGVLSSGSLTADQWLLLVTVYGLIAVHLTFITFSFSQSLVIRSPNFGASLYSTIVTGLGQVWPL